MTTTTDSSSTRSARSRPATGCSTPTSAPSSPAATARNSITSGHRACRGCGEALGARVVLDAAMRATERPDGHRQRDRVPRGLLDAVPRVGLAGPVAALAVRQRCRGGVGRRRRAARPPAATTSACVAQAGDGGTVDIGLGCLSGMFERNDDVLFVCYDNQGYMNTGVQRSGATPPAASTANTRPVGDAAGNAFGTGKSLPLIAMAHEIPYVATATVADLHDLEAKVTKAMSMHGARYLHVLVPCPLGWGSDVRGDDPGGPAGDPVRALPGLRGRARRRSPHVTPIRRPGAGRGLPAPAGPVRAPVRRRGPPGRGRPRSRHRPTATSPATGCSPRRSIMKLPVRRHASAPARAAADLTGSWRTERPSTSTGRAPCGNACPAGEDVRSWLYDAESGGAGYEAAWRRDHGDQPVPGRHGPGLLPPVRDGLQPRQPRRGGRHQLRRAVPRRRGDPAQGWTVTRRPPRRRAGGCWSSAPARPACPRRTTSPCAATRSRSGSRHPAAGGMMRYGIPRYRLPREVLDAEIDRMLALGVHLELDDAGHRPRQR